MGFLSGLFKSRDAPKDSTTGSAYRFWFGGRITPLYHKDILEEYTEVLHRSKFHLEKEFTFRCKQYFTMAQNMCLVIF